jgi:hypothetical protein
MRVHEADENGSTDPIHEENQTQNGFNTKPNGSDEDKDLFELERTKQPQGVTNDTNNKRRDHHTKSFKGWSVDQGCETDQTQDCKSEGNNVAGDHSGSGITATSTVEGAKISKRLVSTCDTNAKTLHPLCKI